MSEALRQPTGSPAETASNSGEHKDSKKESKKKGYLGLVAAEGSVESTTSKQPDRALSVWERFAKQDKQSVESLLSGRDKPERPKLRVIEGGKDGSGTGAEQAGDKPNVGEAKLDGGESSGESDAALETLNPQEARQAVKEYSDNRKKALQESADGSSPDTSAADEAASPAAKFAESTPEAEVTAAVETAANAVLLEEIDRELAADPNKSVEAVVEAAEARTAERIAADGESATGDAIPEAEVISNSEAEPGASETSPVQDPQLSSAEATPSTESGTEDDPTTATATTTPTHTTTPTPAAGGTSGPTGPGGAGGGGLSGGPGGPGGPGGAAGSSGSTPPQGPGFAGSAFNAAPMAAGPNVNVQNVTNERRAMAKGLLVGGIVGYLIGKRRGRIKTEKRLVPIQKKLEKQVRSLHETVAIKEQAVRKLAAEKAQALTTLEAKRQFAERLQATAPKPGEAIAQPVRNGALASTVREQAGTGRAPAEIFKPLVVDAPAVILGGVAALRPERAVGNYQGRQQSVRVEGKRGERPVIDFSKQVEAYSTDELKQAAEQIKIDNTSLKELYDTGRLDEQAVRRVMREFIEGRSVRAAVGRELFQKELKFERDPKMRQAQNGSGLQAGQSGGGASRAAADPTRTTMTGAAAIAGVFGGSPGGRSADGKRPTPDKATVDKLRKQQMAQIAAATAATAAVVGGLIAFLV